MVLLRVFMRKFEWLVRKQTSDLYWLILAILALITFASGFWGWLSYDFVDEAWLPADASQLNYKDYIDALQRGGKALFGSDLYLESDVQGIPPQILIARFAGSLFVLLLAGRLFIFAIGARVAKAFARSRDRHDVLIGDSEFTQQYTQISEKKINHLSGSIAESYTRIAVFERTENLSDNLLDIAAKRSGRILIAESTDAETWETAQDVAALVPDIDIIAHIQDPWLLERISRVDPAARIRPVSFATGAARQIMLAHPPYLMARALNAPIQHIVIVGFGSLGQALLREFLVTSISYQPSQMMVTIIDPDAAALRSEFQARHPGLQPYVDIAFVAGRLTSSSKTVEEFFTKRCEQAQPCAVYIAIGDKDLPLKEAVGVKDRAERLKWFNAPIFVRTQSGSGLQVAQGGVGDLDATGASSSGRISRLGLFPMASWRQAFDGIDLSGAEFDQQAKLFHDAYLKLIGAFEHGDPMSLKPAQRPWELLQEEYRVSNRRTAAHIRAKLDAAGFDLDGWLARNSHNGPPSASLLPKASHVLDEDDLAELGRLGNLEHTRWSVDRTLNGWRYGSERDDIAKLHPDLKPGRELDEEAVEKDRDNVRAAMSIIRKLTE